METRVIRFGNEMILDISSLNKKEIHELVSDLPVKRLKVWLEHYTVKEQYEICSILKEIVDKKLQC